MHPAYSIIFFTTTSGAGYGVMIVMAGLAAADKLPAGAGFLLAAFAAAFGLISAGLLSSALHLGHPERAWRAFSQWRSSWLSREGVVALASYPVAGAFGLASLLLPSSSLVTPLAVATVVICVITVFCTSMIYASLQPIRHWHNAWVPANYLALSLMTGALWLHAIAGLFAMPIPELGWLSLTAVLLGWLLKLGYWRFADNDAHAPTIESATGLGALGAVRMLDAPHTADNYLLKEMGYRIARKHADKLRRVAVALGFAAPLVLTLGALALDIAWGAAAAAVLAAVSASVGIVVERWLFFAEAKHSVTLYYGARTA